MEALRDRPLFVNKDAEHVFEIPYQLKEDAVLEGSVVLLPQVMEPGEPPSQRAWALQERLMSPRILEYGSFQTGWICNYSLKHKRLTDRYHDKTVIYIDGKGQSC